MSRQMTLQASPSAEREFISLMREITKKLATYTSKMLRDYPTFAVRTDASRRRNVRLHAQIAQYAADYESWFDKKKKQLRAIIAKIESTVNASNSLRWRATVKDGAATRGLDDDAAQFVIAQEPGIPRAVSERWTDRMMQLIRYDGTTRVPPIPIEHFQKLERITQEAVHSGLRTEELQKQLRQLDGVSKRRAEVIARDQIGKYNGRMTRIRQENIGVKSYVWRTSSDERVRDEHRARDGRTFYYANPPRDGNPGEPVQCRCWADPDLDAAFRAYQKG